MTCEMGAPVETAHGRVAGEALWVGAQRVYRYRAIPYATPPVGPRRWRHAEPAASWSGVRLATRFAPDCPQVEWPEMLRFLAEPRGLVSEDCLYLNIWTTAEPTSSAEPLRPVMVWIYGGGMVWGRSSHPLYDGAELAKKGAVVVTFNYRVGIFGFFAHPELSAESPYGASGNYGLGDQVAALRWIRENIEQFGGDPNNVTIFGESGGCQCVHLLTACPPARGLFHRAAGVSAHNFIPMLSATEAEKADSVPGATAESLSSLRGLPAAEVLRRAEKTRFGNYCPDAAIVDGHFISHSVREVYERSEQAKIPLLLGCTSDEGSLMPPIVPAEEFARELLCRPLLDWADLAAPVQPVYFFLFSHVAPGADREVQQIDGSWRTPGAFHTAEVSFVFNNERHSPRFSPNMPVGEPREVDLELAELMSDFWIAFATHGSPTLSSAHEEWERYDPVDGHYYEFCATPRSSSRIHDRLLTV